MQRQMEDRRAPNQNFYHVNGSSDSVRFSGVGGRRVGEAVVGFAAAVRGVLRRINAKHNGLLLLGLNNGGLLGLASGGGGWGPCRPECDRCLG